MTVDFRQRAAFALTHPATLAALGALLLNDIVLKRLWPGAWVTGKLSDLAWMIFAPPLLAYLLSLAAPRRSLVHVGLAGFATAYLGLPLLYAAFNTFAPVHDVILRGLALVGGGRPGSPLDATDSLVIPFAMAVAVWVWRQPPVDAGGVRARLTLLTMAVAALASVASSQGPTQLGVTGVDSADGVIYAEASYRFGGGPSCYASEDAGMAWEDTECVYNREQRNVSNPVAETPRGRYEIAGSDIVRVGGSRREVVHSTGYLRKGPNMWLQTVETSDLWDREVTTTPYSIFYDERSGNLIVAMGLQGVVVGDPGETWTRVAVGHYAPIDFSFINKVRPLKDRLFLLMALVLSLSFANLALSLAKDYMKSKTASSLLSLEEYEPITAGARDLLKAVLSLVGLAWLALAIVLYASLQYGFYPDGNYDLIDGLCKLLLAVAALLLSGIGILTNLCDRPNLKQTSSVAVAVGGMFLLVGLCFVLWLQLNLPLFAANVAAVVLMALAAFALWGYLVRSGAGRGGEAD